MSDKPADSPGVSSEDATSSVRYVGDGQDLANLFPPPKESKYMVNPRKHFHVRW